MNIEQLDELYKLYKFQILPIHSKELRVYSFTNKYFSNADVILLRPVDTKIVDRAKKEIENLGFSVTVRDYKTLEEAEESLFDGFFDIDRSNKLLKKQYADYTQKIERVIFGPYEYINSEYHDEENNTTRTDDIVQTLMKNLAVPGPVLVLLEGAAGFGKTSTSYELIKHLSEDRNSKRIPLFTELSRNRQASIFKYVLYDEINSRFTGLSLELIKKQIIDGRIPVIIDGFDELLKQKSVDRTEDKFEDAEPMLETIKELLTGQSKIVLTTRRTAIFSDDDFFKWLEEHETNFTFYRYSISDPTIGDWISVAREKLLRRAGLNLKSISNPVLLAYLRSMKESQFENCIQDIDLIIENYIVRLMERENERQDLKMSVDEQKTILKIISHHFTTLDVTSDNKETIEKRIREQVQQLLFEVLERFTPDKRPSIDQLINKLIIHAFLDRKGDADHRIGFVNDFILGSFVGSNLLEIKDNWIGTERFIDFIVTAYTPRNLATRSEIYNLLNHNLLKYVDVKKQVFIDNYLFGRINRDLKDEFLELLEFRNHFSQGTTITRCIFSDCQFFSVNFSAELEHVTDTYFINCTFYECQTEGVNYKIKGISFTNCVFDSISDLGLVTDAPESEVPVEIESTVYQRKVLERFWQSGKERFNPHKRQGTLRQGSPPEEVPFIDEAIEELIKKGYIVRLRGHHSLDLNIKYIKEIKQILGR
jgi:hypothetical protein